VSHYKFIEAAKKEHKVSIQCRVLKVSRAAYYRWTKGPRAAALKEMRSFSPR
jgi:hypothetical protein